MDGRRFAGPSRREARAGACRDAAVGEALGLAPTTKDPSPPTQRGTRRSVSRRRAYSFRNWASFRRLYLVAWAVSVGTARRGSPRCGRSFSEAFRLGPTAARILSTDQTNRFHRTLSSNDERLRQERRGLRRTLAVRDNAETNRRRDPFEVEVLQQQDDQLDAAVDAEGPGPTPAAAEPLKALATERDGDGGGSSSSPSRLGGLLSLATVPVVWGTYVPAVRLMYEGGVPGLVFSASYHAVSALASAAALRLASPSPAGPRADGEGTGATAKATGAEEDPEQGSRDVTNAADGGPGPMAVAFRGGLELGAYTFAASSMQVVGLETVPSDRAGFLIQLTTIMVPIVQAALDRDFRSVPASTWTGCLLALAGVVVMGADPSAWTTAASPPSLLSSIPAAFTRGDALIVAAAFLYTLHVVRLGYWAKRTSPLRLATAKSTVQTTFSLCFVALLWHYGAGAAASGSAAAQAADPVSAASHGLASFALSAGREIAAFFGTFASKVSSGQISPPSLLRLAGTVLWCGTAGNAYALYAQSAGQRTVAPSDANLVYSLQPVFTALFAYLLLGETMDAAGLAGGALVLAAVYLVAAEALLSGSRGKAPESGTH